jgi:hypothetical protein
MYHLVWRLDDFFDVAFENRPGTRRKVQTYNLRPSSGIGRDFSCDRIFPDLDRTRVGAHSTRNLVPVLGIWLHDDVELIHEAY